MKKLSHKDVCVEFKFNISKNTCPFDRLYDRVSSSKYELDFDVFLPTKGFNLQRPLVWTLHQKQQFILSIMKGLAIPKIAVIRHVNEDDSTVWQIIDGKQRISTYLQYVAGEFPIIHNGIEYFFKDLDELFQFKMNTYDFYGDIAYSYWDKPISDDDKILWFNQINFAGTPQDEEHMNMLLSVTKI